MSSLRAVGRPIPATPPAHGLVASAFDVTNLEDERWDLGMQFCPENCVEARPYDPDCAVWPLVEATGEVIKPVKSEAFENLACYDVDPFVIESPFECSSAGFSTQDYRGRAVRQLEAGTSKAMEFEFWTGTLKPTNPHLTDPTSAVVLAGGNPQPLQQAIALLGQALSNCAHGGVGMIHAPTFVVDNWMYESGGNFIREVGGKLVTTNRGDIVVSGAGYPGTGPGNTPPPPGTAWAYATGPVHYRLSEVFVYPDTMSEALQRQTNQVEYRAERIALYNYDPCCGPFAVLVRDCC